MKRNMVLSVLFLILAMQAAAQIVVKGTVQDNKNNPVAGASVAIRDSYDGAVTDSAGKFVFLTTEKGEKIFTVSAVGYKNAEVVLRIDENVQPVQVVLKEEINEMKAVVITAGSFEASDKKRGTVLSSIDILTTASANADVTGAIATLPGAQQVGEKEGLFVRGGTGSEARIYIDGNLVNNFFYSSAPNIASRGRFSPWIFKGTIFSAGGYSALYGQALSSALILESIDLPDQSSASLNVSVIGAGGGLQKLSKNKKYSWGANYNYMNLWPAYQVIRPKQDFSQMPEYHDADANFRIKSSPTGILKYYGYFSANRFGFTVNSIDTIGYQDAFRMKNVNTYQSLSWRESLGNRWRINAGVSYTNNKDDISSSIINSDQDDVLLTGLEHKKFSADLRGNFFNVKAVLEKKYAGLNAIRFGGEYNMSDDDINYTIFSGQTYTTDIKEHLKSVFAETDIYLTNEVAAKVGSRMEHSSLLNRFNFAPRLSLAYKLGNHSQASVAYGVFYQNPETRYMPAAGDLTFAKAAHYIAQYQKMGNNQTFRAEVFYKKYEHLVKTSFVSGREAATSNNGFGHAKGFEIFWRDRRTIRNFDYWVSYSYLDTKRDFLNYPSVLEPNFAARHTANLVVKKFITKMKTQFNANYVYSTGRPYYNIGYDNSMGKFSIRDQGRTIPYNSLSLSVNYLPNVFKKGAGKYTVFVFSITNVLGSRQEFGYNYSNNGIRKEAIVPPSRTFVFLGAFINFGVDRTDDIINSKL